MPTLAFSSMHHCAPASQSSSAAFQSEFEVAVSSVKYSTSVLKVFQELTKNLADRNKLMLLQQVCTRVNPQQRKKNRHEVTYAIIRFIFQHLI